MQSEGAAGSRLGVPVSSLESSPRLSQRCKALEIIPIFDPALDRKLLSQQGFTTDLSGELIVGRLQGVPQPLCEEQLRMVGRLIGFSRQLDILLRDDRTVDQLVNAFLESRFHMTIDTLMKERDHADEH
jgi:hypothetical protein